MTITESDSFIRANQTGWGSFWVAQDALSTLNIASNEGTATTTGSSNILVAPTPAYITVNFETKVRFSITVNSTDAVFALARWLNSSNYYYFGWVQNTVSLRKVVGGTSTTVVNATKSISNSTFYWLRARVQGQTFMVRVWQDGTLEPGAWDLVASDTQLSGAGNVGLRVYGGTANADTIKVDTYSLDNLAAAYPTVTPAAHTFPVLIAPSAPAFPVVTTPGLAFPDILAVPAASAFPLVTTPGFLFPDAVASPSGIVSGSANIIANAALAESAQVVETTSNTAGEVANAALSLGTALVIETTAQAAAEIANAALALNSALVIETTSNTAAEIANAALVETSALILAPATVQANATLAETLAQLVALTAPVVVTASLAETLAQIVASSTILEQANALLVATVIGRPWAAAVNDVLSGAMLATPSDALSGAMLAAVTDGLSGLMTAVVSDALSGTMTAVVSDGLSGLMTAVASDAAA